MSNKAEAAAVFAVMDRNGDGSLDPVELSCRLSDFGVPDEHIERLFYLLDTDNDGVISLEEFVGGYDAYLSILSGGPVITPRPSSKWEPKVLAEKVFLATLDAIPPAFRKVAAGLGRIVALYCRSS